MSIKKFIRTLLKLKGLRIKRFRFSAYSRKLWLEVKPYKNGARCPHCGRRCKAIRTIKKEREWRDLPVTGKEISLTYKPREIDCPTHGRVQEEIPWAAPNARITYRFEYMLLYYAKNMTQTAAARLLKIPGSTFSNILHRTIERTRESHKIRNLQTIGVDEISYKKGHL